jgi:hypothetical protein
MLSAFQICLIQPVYNTTERKADSDKKNNILRHFLSRFSEFYLSFLSPDLLHGVRPSHSEKTLRKSNTTAAPFLKIHLAKKKKNFARP